MKRHFFHLLPALICVAMLVGGCGTTGLRGPTGLDWSKPWTLLPSADVEQAKSVAMGSAVTKGWKIADASGKRLLVKRPLGTAEAEAVVGEPISTPLVEVRTDFRKRRGGVAVSAAAAVVGDKTTKKGKKAAVRVDVTESYQDGLNLSLGALRRSWEEHHRRATAAAAWPAKDTKDATSKEEGTEDPPPATATPSPPEESAAVSIAATSTDDIAAPKEDEGISGAIVDRKIATTTSPPTGEGTVAPIAAPNTGDVTASVVDRKVATATPPLVGESTAAPTVTPSTGNTVVPVEERALTTPPPPHVRHSTGPESPGEIGQLGLLRRALCEEPRM